MSSVEIKSFLHESGLVKQFVEFPYSLYSDDFLWVPPFRDNVYALLAESNPFFQRGTEQRFLALRGGKVVARAAAIINPALPQSPPTGFFGFFDCEDDLEAVRELMNALCEFLKGKGCTVVKGPLNRDAWTGYRIMTKGFREQPIYLEPYNGLWYGKHLEELGFRPAVEFISAINVQPEKALGAFKGGITFAERNGVTFRSFNMDKFDSEMKRLYDIFTATVENEFGYKSVSFADFKARYEQIKDLLDPSVIIIGSAPNGQAAGYIFGMPECSRPIAAMGGNKGFFSRIQYWLNTRQRSPIINYTSPRVVPAARGKGMTNALKYKLYEAALAGGYTRAHYRTIRKDVLAQRPEEDAKVTYKEYALYARAL